MAGHRGRERGKGGGTMTTAREIGFAFKDRLEAYALSNLMPVAWPNIDFTPSGDLDAPPYLEIQFAPAPNERLTLGDRSRVYGSVIITVVARKGVGSARSEEVADEIAGIFPVDFTMGRTRVTVAPSVREGIRDGAHWRVPVVIPYEILI